MESASPVMGTATPVRVSQTYPPGPKSPFAIGPRTNSTYGCPGWYCSGVACQPCGTAPRGDQASRAGSYAKASFSAGTTTSSRPFQKRAPLSFGAPAVDMGLHRSAQGS